jgi:hypothetical protein
MVRDRETHYERQVGNGHGDTAGNTVSAMLPRCVPRHADANLMYGSVHAVRQHDG